MSSVQDRGVPEPIRVRHLYSLLTRHICIRSWHGDVYRVPSGPVLVRNRVCEMYGVYGGSIPWGRYGIDQVRIAPAFGIGGIANTELRTSLQKHATVSSLFASPLGVASSSRLFGGLKGQTVSLESK
eukprot:GDKI01009216.1.p2 GENE.GDKI01009216.1~~GDKI01009216.1.p2  ORF type:complete len:127 (-),score=0.88 GDKI01009216.1:220-600(-)